MILRNIASRHGRVTIAAPFSRTLRYLSTETEHIDSSLPTTATQVFPPRELNLIKIFTKNANKSRKQRRLTPTQSYMATTKHIQETTGQLGSIVGSHYEPDAVLENPPRVEDVTLELLMASQAHMGHSTSLWNPANQRYIYGIRQGIHIISLEETAAHLRRAAKVVEGVTYSGGLVLFVGTRPNQDLCVIQAASLSKGCHLFQRWIPGSITNSDKILANCQTKIVNEFDKEIEGYEEKLRELPALKPDLVVCLNPLENYICLHECGLHNIPTIGVIDTDANPTWVTYPIPANDDSIRCIQVIAGVLGRAGEEGQRRRLEQARLKNITWKPPFGLGAPKKDGIDASKDGINLMPRAASRPAYESSELNF